MLQGAVLMLNRSAAMPAHSSIDFQMNFRRNRSRRTTFAGICQCCGVQFYAKTAYAKWCSSNCRTQAYRCRLAGKPVKPGSGRKLIAYAKPVASSVQPAGQLEMREWNGTAIQRRQSDGFVNATAMAKANDKHLPHYMANERTREYLQALSRSVGIPTDQLAVSTMTGPNHLRGTWIHPRLAVDLARWISPAFAVWMDGWFLESLTKPQEPKLAPGVHVVANTMNDARRMFSAAMRTELIATLNLCDQDLFGTTDLPAPRFHYHLGA